VHFHLLMQSIPEDKLILEADYLFVIDIEHNIRSLGPILSNIQGIYQVVCRSCQLG